MIVDDLRTPKRNSKMDYEDYHNLITEYKFPNTNLQLLAGIY